MQVAKEGQINLVLMDVGLPDIDGREAVRILRRKTVLIVRISIKPHQ
jgi:CheY-like chemotaxis protein